VSDVGVSARGEGGSTPAKPRAERPTYALGEKWIRIDGVFELVRIEDDRYVFVADPGKEVHLTKDLMVARVQKHGSVAQFDPPPALSWPLEVGKWGTAEGTWRTPQRPGGFPARFTWSVDAYEEVDVIAGKFMAFRILLVMSPTGPSAGSQRWRSELQMWYAPDARQFVKAVGQGLGMFIFQVVSVERPDLAPLQVALRAPQDQARVTAEDLVVAGKAATGKLLQRITATLNGKEVKAFDERGADKKEVVFNFPVKLREGKNVLIVTAVDSRGETIQEARTLFYEKPAPPPPAAPCGGPPPAGWRCRRSARP